MSNVSDVIGSPQLLIDPTSKSISIKFYNDFSMFEKRRISSIFEWSGVSLERGRFLSLL